MQIPKLAFSKVYKKRLERALYAFAILTLLPVSVPDFSKSVTAEANNGGGQPEVIEVTPTQHFGNPSDDPTNWFFYNDATDPETNKDVGVDNSIGSFVSGPGTPPIGSGSAEISYEALPDENTTKYTYRPNLATIQFGDIKFDEIFALTFSTYQPSSNPSANQIGYLHVNVDFYNSGTLQSRLIFHPADNTDINSQNIQQDTWQTWDAIQDGDALWRWSGYGSNGNKWPDDITTEARTLSDLVNAFPELRMHKNYAWLGIRMGSPYLNGFTGYVDNFTIGYETGVEAEWAGPLVVNNTLNIAQANFIPPSVDNEVYVTFDFDPDKQSICHATGNPFKPYVEIKPDHHGWEHGHDNHEDDIILEIGESCPGPNQLPAICGDTIINQDWEQCDGGQGCTETCQLEEQNQCSDLVLARVLIPGDGVKNWGDGDMTGYIYLGSDTNILPAGAWFPLYHKGSYFTDPDIAGYEDVAGLAVQRLDDSVRVVMHGSGTDDDKEHVHGSIQFYNATPTQVTNDASGNNTLENGFNGTGVFVYNASNDEVWLDNATPELSNFWLTTTVADDGFYTEWSIDEDCEELEPICGNDIQEVGEQCDGDDGVSTGYYCSDNCELVAFPVCEPGSVDLMNAGFEEPVVTDSKKWEIHNSVPGWDITWESAETTYNSATRPDDALLELHKNIFGPASEGEQYVELDTDWGVENGEPASVRISQDVATFAGATYELTFAFTPRPDTDANDNVLEVSADGSVLALIGPMSSAMDWQDYSYQFVATDDTTTISFADKGTANSLGTFLDDVRLDLLQCAEECQPEAGWADMVVENDQGTLKNGNAITDVNRIDATKVLDVADGKFFSLGKDGSITVGFSKAVNNVSGDDISIHELTNGRAGYPEEKASIEVSQDGATWYTLTGLASSKATDGITYYDFDETGLSWIQYVRVSDATDFSLHNNNADGFDLDAVDATELLCDVPEPDEVLTKVCAVKYFDAEQDGEMNNSDYYLSDWQMNLWQEVDSFSLDSAVATGIDSNLVFDSAEEYLIVVSGTWQNNYTKGNQFDVDAEYNSYDGWSSHQNGPALGENQLDVQVGESFVDWGTYVTDHTYYHEMTGTDQVVNFRVFDGNPDTNTINAGWYSDNNGTLDVVVYQKIADGLTDGESGYCFEDLENGTYLVSETMQEDWVATTDMYQSASLDDQNSNIVVSFGNYQDNGSNGGGDEGDAICGYKYEVDAEGTILGGLADWEMTLWSAVEAGTYSLDANDTDGITIAESFTSDTVYKIEVSGTADAGDGIEFDAKYSERNSSGDWTDAVQNYESEGPELLDIQINGTSPDWGAYHDNHTYFTVMQGDDTLWDIAVNDIFHSNNSGSFTITVYELTNTGETTMTGENGSYCFEDLETGHYVVSETEQDGFMAYDTPYCQIMDSSEAETQCNLYNIAEPETTGTITVCKYNDVDKDGEIEDEHPTIAGWLMTVMQDEETVTSGETGENGCITFTLDPGAYDVYEALYEGWFQSYPTSNGGQNYFPTVVVETGSDQTVSFYNYQSNGGSGDPDDSECTENCGNGGGGPTVTTTSTGSSGGTGAGGNFSGGGPLACIEIDLVPLSLNGVDPIVYNPGGKAKFEISITNTCAGTATNAVVTNVLPAGFTFSGAVSGDLEAAVVSGYSIAAVSNDGGTQDWNAGDLEQGESWSTTYEVDIASTVLPGNYTNYASVVIDGASASVSTDNDTEDMRVQLATVQGYSFEAEPTNTTESPVQVLGYTSLPETGGALPNTQTNPLTSLWFVVGGMCISLGLAGLRFGRHAR